MYVMLTQQFPGLNEYLLHPRMLTSVLKYEVKLIRVQKPEEKSVF